MAGDVDHHYEELLTGELAICERLTAELQQRRVALKHARLRIRLGVATEVVRAELQEACPDLLIEMRCPQCERALLTCTC